MKSSSVYHTLFYCPCFPLWEASGTTRSRRKTDLWVQLGSASPAFAKSSKRGYITQLSTVPAEEELLVRAGQGKQRRTKHTLPRVGSFQPPRSRQSPTAFGSRTVGAGDDAARHRAFPGHLPRPSPALAQFLLTGSYGGSTHYCFDTRGSFLLLQPLLPVW